MATSSVRRGQVRLLVLALLIVVLSLGFFNAGAQEVTNINVYSSADTNITDWMQNTVIPAFTAEHPEYTVTLVIVRGGVGIYGIAQRTLAALEAGVDPQVDYFEGLNPLDFPPETIEADLWMQLDESNVPNLANVNPAAQISPYGAPYRASQVLLAYNSAMVSEEDVPHTFPELVDWIKANPGQFVYSRPDRGGSGGNFVVRAIYEANGRDPSLFTPETYTPERAEEYLMPAWELLREIHPFIYENGSYPAGNTPVLQLLANESVSMASVWSDQSIQALSIGALPETVKLVQFEDLTFPGSFVYSAIPRNAENLEGALAFANFMISVESQVSVVREIGGFPSINWDLLPQELQQEFTSVISEDVPPNWPGGDWNAARNQGWYEFVATNIDPNS